MAITVLARKEDRVVFTSRPTSVSVRDVIDAAHFRGEVGSHWEELLIRVEAEKMAGETGVEMDDSAIDASAVAFRYQYDLITAEETERWLELRGLTLSDFSAYFAREYWGKTSRAKPSSPAIPLHEASADLRELLAVELTLNGQLDAMAGRLSWRMAASEDAEIGSAQTEAERTRFVERSGVRSAEISNWLAALGRDDAWFEQALTMEAAFRKECEKLLTPAAAEREIGALRLPLTRLEVETIEFESYDAASEAIWCVRNDGMSMAEVAQEGRYPYERAERVLEGFADDLQQRFLSLTPGSVLEPIPREDGFQVSRLLGKAEPRVDDPDVRARIEQRILERHFADLTSKSIEWEIRPVSTE